MIIVITRPDFFVGEAERITALLTSGKADLIHIRKPQSNQYEVEQLLCDLPAVLYPRLVLHDHHPLAMRYGLRGVHLNRRNPNPPADWTGAVSISCHTLDELAEARKQSYEQIEEARLQGLIDERVMALGGVTFSKIEEVKQMGFGGAMILGDAWK